MQELGIGIIGCGNISGIYFENLPRYRGVAVRGCADVMEAAAQAQGAKYGVRADSVEALLARSDIDLVINLTVPNAHYGVSAAAVAAGKHVFSEKPLTVDLADGRRLVEDAERRGVRLGCAPDTFLGAGGQQALQALQEGRIGRVLAGTAFVMSHGMEHWHPNPEFFFKPGGGPVLDIGPYYITTLVALLGPVKRVFGMTQAGFAERIVTANSPNKGQRIVVETPTTAMSLLEFASGAQINLVLSWDVWKHGHPPIELYGTEGSMRVPDPNFFGGTVEITQAGGDWQPLDTAEHTFGRPNWRSPNWPADAPSRANYRGLGPAELASAVSQGTPHRASGRLALHVLEVMHAVLTSGATGSVVAIESQCERPAALTEDDARRLWR